jgi:hypothetical protein
VLSACFAFKRQEECRKRYGGYPRTGYSTLSCALSMTGRESPWYRCRSNFSHGHGPNDTRLYSVLARDATKLLMPRTLIPAKMRS